MAIENQQLVSSYGSLWARNRENISRLRAMGKLYGVYVLCDGSMPVYIGRGRLSSRIGAIGAARAEANSGTISPGTPSPTDGSRQTLRRSCSACFLSFYEA